MSANKSLISPKLLLGLMLSVAFAGGCNKETNNDGAVRGAVWAVSADCRSCLENQCATPGGASASSSLCRRRGLQRCLSCFYELLQTQSLAPTM